MPEPVWIGIEVALACHEELLAREGGAPGIRDIALLESALARPLNSYAYGLTDVFKLAAAYAYGIAKNPPFVDGNKRSAFLLCSLFLAQKSYILVASREDKIQMFMKLANGTLNEDELAKWLRANSELIKEHF